MPALSRLSDQQLLEPPAEPAQAQATVISGPAAKPGPITPGGLVPREQGLCNGISSWLSPLAMVITQDVALPAFFSVLMPLSNGSRSGRPASA